MDAVLFGPKGAGPHSAVEWVDLQSAVDLAQILVETGRSVLWSEQNQRFSSFEELGSYSIIARD